jgi:hypothetical protein
MAHSIRGAGRIGHALRRSPTTRTRRTRTTGWPLSLFLGVLYGLWAAEILRSTHRPAPITTGNVVFGVVSGVIVAVLAFGLHQMPRRVPAEIRATAWAVFSGAAFGYLYGLTDAPAFRTVVIGLLTAAGFFVMSFYHYHVTETPPDDHYYYRRHPDHRIRT